MTIRSLRILPYMDDYLGFFGSKAEALQARQQMDLTLDFLGIKRNLKKSVWEPTQMLRHLGLSI
jgi:hypothetical protein